MIKRAKPDFGSQFRILLADRDDAFGRRLAQALKASEEFRLCGHVADALLAQTMVAAENPDLVVASTEPDSPSAFNLFRYLTATVPECRILATSRHCDPAKTEQAFSAGAHGFLLTAEPADEMLSALRAVTEGHIYVSRILIIPLLKRLLSESSDSALGGVESLTDRELQVFELLGSGLSTREVAERLHLSWKTINSHRAKIQHRLGAESAAALARLAFSRTGFGLRTGYTPENNTSESNFASAQIWGAPSDT